MKCLFCNKEFIEAKNKKGIRKYCSNRCRALSNYHKKCNFDRVVLIKNCVWCGEEFHIKPNTPMRIFCSRRCRDKNYHELHPYTAHNKGSRYRAKKNGNTVGKVDFEYICKRDQWVCQICGKKVNKLRKRPDPLSPSLDHIKPISLGGFHSHDNVQLAHLRCNLSKGASVGYQMRLIG